MKPLLLVSLVLVASLQAQPKVQSFTLPNKLQVLVLEDHDHPLVRARLHLRIEASDTPPGRQGLPQLALRMFTQSDAADLKAEELTRLLEDSGIQQIQTAAPGGLDWWLVARSRDQDRALGLLANRLLRTLFEPALLEAQRLACWREENRQDEDPFLRLRHALSQNLASKPTFASLGAITWEDLLAFRAQVFRPERAVLVLHGDLGLEQAKRLVLLSLGTWTAQEAPVRSLTSERKTLPPIAAGPLWMTSNHPGIRVQAAASQPEGLPPESVALLTLLVPGDPALAPVRMAAVETCLLATYDAELGTPADQALATLKGRLEALARRGYTQADLERARTAWQAGRSLTSLHPEAQMDAALAETQGRSVAQDRLMALTPDQLNADLRRWLEAANLRMGGLGASSPRKGQPNP